VARTSISSTRSFRSCVAYLEMKPAIMVCQCFTTAFGPPISVGKGFSTCRKRWLEALGATLSSSTAN
jgi:hypothetical protein